MLTTLLLGLALTGDASLDEQEIPPEAFEAVRLDIDHDKYHPCRLLPEPSDCAEKPSFFRPEIAAKMPPEAGLRRVVLLSPPGKQIILIVMESSVRVSPSAPDEIVRGFTSTGAARNVRTEMVDAGAHIGARFRISSEATATNASQLLYMFFGTDGASSFMFIQHDTPEQLAVVAEDIMRSVRVSPAFQPYDGKPDTSRKEAYDLGEKVGRALSYTVMIVVALLIIRKARKRQPG
jgi:hypothetical protein